MKCLTHLCVCLCLLTWNFELCVKSTEWEKKHLHTEVPVLTQKKTFQASDHLQSTRYCLVGTFIFKKLAKIAYMCIYSRFADALYEVPHLLSRTYLFTIWPLLKLNFNRTLVTVDMLVFYEWRHFSSLQDKRMVWYIRILYDWIMWKVNCSEINYLNVRQISGVSICYFVGLSDFFCSILFKFIDVFWEISLQVSALPAADQRGALRGQPAEARLPQTLQWPLWNPIPRLDCHPKLFTFTISSNYDLWPSPGGQCLCFPCFFQRVKKSPLKWYIYI